MTEEQLNKQMKQRELKASADKSPEIKRRRLIKGAVAIPVIMTLSSGAAAARSSNYFGAADIGDAMTGDDDRPICVEAGLNDAGKVDVGDVNKVNAHLGVKDVGCGEGNGFMISQGAHSSLMDKGVTISVTTT